MTLEHVTDHEDAGVALLVSQFKDKQRIEALLRSWLKQAQTLEDVFWDLLLLRSLSNATGAQLASLGRIVGQRREGRTNEAYRLWIGARVLVNRSSGLVEQVIGIIKKLVGADVRVRLEEEYPAAFTAHLDDPIDGQDGVEIAKILQLAKAAGVRALLHWQTTSYPFRFAPADVSVKPSPYGFGVGRFSAVSDGRDIDWPDLTPVELLGHGLIEYWDSRHVTLASGEVDAWPGQAQGIAIPYLTGRPTYNTSDPRFAGKPSISISATGNRRLVLDGHPTDIVPSGTRPYMAWVSRLRSPAISSTDKIHVQLRSTGLPAIDFRGWGNNTVSTTERVQLSLSSGGASCNLLGEHSTQTHLHEIILDAVDGVQYVRDGVVRAANPAGIGTTTAAMRGVGVGNGSPLTPELDIGVLIVCAQAPLPSQRAELLAWARAEWGVS